MSKTSTKPGRAFFEVAPAEDLFVQEQRQAKLLDYVGVRIQPRAIALAIPRDLRLTQ
jgi:hypothetical protein